MDQMRLLVERTVSQLDFGNFVPSYNVTDQRINAGNPNLEPEKTWIYELGYEHRLADDAGVLEARGFYHSITDYIEKVPFIDPDGEFDSQQGNIPEAEIYGLEANASVRLVWFNLRDATLTGRYLRQWSSVSDPFTFEDRVLNDDRGYSWSLGFRHDIRPWSMSYGFDYEGRGEQFISDLTVREYYSIDPRWTAFAERRLFGTTTLRLEVINLFGATEFRRRIQYVTNVMDGTVRRFEEWDETRDIRFALRFRGRF
jgi:outer membrane receptor protein involved in Fe transport